ncbi:energy-coupling factor transporter transmembrane component T family protein [Alkalihalophilus marmarensis]|uniref:energy-coupling factor transporter transmembrane component T family protein n=1 Tax=Alkalihalophilus marmarensis TaxID=521377 RepID=UPI002DBD22A2|nr:energy-coupling factor transporter transmembrane component T [Alkalihalophilus marmarensis]MEC2073918.1 energy-coupling factor transporter transmembrane component T [Alkalihalophilus marmarensis]
MFQNVIIGQYVQGNSFLHKLDPRSKLISVFILLIIIFFADNWFSSLLLVGLTVMLMAISKVPLLFLYRGLRPILWLVLFTLILHILLTKEGPVLMTLGPIAIHEGGVMNGLFIATRLLTLVMLTSLITLTTSPIDLTDGLESLFTPLKKVGLPAHELALMMSIALRFIPTFMQETEKILKAQMARGVDFSSGPISKRIKALLPLLVPLFISAFKRAEDLALAMEARGYRGGEGRTKLRLLMWNGKDSFVVVSAVLIGVGIILLRNG